MVRVRFTYEGEFQRWRRPENSLRARSSATAVRGGRRVGRSSRTLNSSCSSLVSCNPSMLRWRRQTLSAQPNEGISSVRDGAWGRIDNWLFEECISLRRSIYIGIWDNKCLLARTLVLRNTGTRRCGVRLGCGCDVQSRTEFFFFEQGGGGRDVRERVGGVVMVAETKTRRKIAGSWDKHALSTGSYFPWRTKRALRGVDSQGLQQLGQLEASPKSWVVYKPMLKPRRPLTINDGTRVYPWFVLNLYENSKIMKVTYLLHMNYYYLIIFIGQAWQRTPWNSLVQQIAVVRSTGPHNGYWKLMKCCK